MPRMLTLRALCERCEKAEAGVWCVAERAAFCAPCNDERHAQRNTRAHLRVPIPAASVVAALCPHCSAAPAALFRPAHGSLLCDLCAQSLRRSAGFQDRTVSPVPCLMPQRQPQPHHQPHHEQLEPRQLAAAAVEDDCDVLLRDMPAAESLAFDRMDFSSMHPDGTRVADLLEGTRLLPVTPVHAPVSLAPVSLAPAGNANGVTRAYPRASSRLDDEWVGKNACLTSTSSPCDPPASLPSGCFRVAMDDARPVDLSYFQTPVPTRCRSQSK